MPCLSPRGLLSPQRLPGISSLVALFNAGQAVQLRGTLGGSGTGVLTLTITGQPAQWGTHVDPVDVQCMLPGTLGNSKIRWSRNGGKNWSASTLTAASMPIGADGVTLNIPAGTMTVLMRWTSAYVSLGSLVGSQSATLAPAGTILFQPWSFNGTARAFFSIGTELEEDSGILAAVLNGTDKPFTLVLVGQNISIDQALATAQPMIGWARQSVSGNPFWQFGVRGPAAAPANNWTSVREDNVPVAVTLNSAVGAPVPDERPTVYVIRSIGGTALNVKRYPQNETLINGAQDVGAMTIDRFSWGAIHRSGNAIQGSNHGGSRCILYNADIGALAAETVGRAMAIRYALAARFQVHTVHAIIFVGQSNQPGANVDALGAMAPPPGSRFTQIKMLRRNLVGNEAISDTVLQDLNFSTTVAAGTYHGCQIQCCFDLWAQGKTVAPLIIAANGSAMVDWIAGGSRNAALQTAIANFATLLAAEYPNAQIVWHLHINQGENEAKQGTNTAALAWPTDCATLVTNVSTYTGQAITAPVIIQIQHNLPAAPQLTDLRASQATAATNLGGTLILTDDASDIPEWLQSDLTHWSGRGQNWLGEQSVAPLAAQM